MILSDVIALFAIVIAPFAASVASCDNATYAGTPLDVTINLPLSVDDDSSFVRATVQAAICFPLI